MVEHKPAQKIGSERRRSARLEHAVAITVSGTDALGQPFTLRTTTLAVNIHGCMFQSAHYVLRGSALSIEVAGAKPGDPPRRVRGKVIRAQRPGQPGQPFRIAVEIDPPGNPWGVAFPPKDWGPVAGAEEVAEPAPVSAEVSAAAPEAPPAAPPPAGEAAPAEPPAAEAAPAAQPEVPQRPPATGPVEAPAADSGAARRRSTRIVQSVPLTVVGVNALGQPFNERTSTLIINCHGCKYASKHYVLKNSWVTLEVPHPEPGHPPRKCRARVTFVQRPRTVRELFQVGVELEVGGNLWGIAFPPSDWFPFPADYEPNGELPPTPPLEEIPEPAAAPPPPPPAAQQAPPPPAARPPAPEAKVRAFPPAASPEAAAALSRQMAHLVAEARAELKQQVWEMVSSSVGAETSRLLRDLNRQMETAAAQAVERAAQRILEESSSELAAQREKAAAEAGEAVRGAAARAQESFTAALEAQLAGARGQVQDLSDRLAGLLREGAAAADALARTRQGLDESFTRTLEQRIAEAEQRLARAAADVTANALDTAEVRAQMDAVAAEVRAALHQRTEDELSAAAVQWLERVQHSVDSAAAQLESRLAPLAESAAARAEQDLRARAAAVSEEMEQRFRAAQAALDEVRAALQRETQAARTSQEGLAAAMARVEQAASQLDAAAARAAQEMERRLAETAARQGQALEQQAAALAGAFPERVRPLLEAAERESAERLAARAAELAAQAEAQAQELARVRQRAVEEAGGELNQTFARLRDDFDRSARELLAKWLEELDAKGTDATHTAFEALYKAAGWYEKKAQTSMQAALDRLVAQTAEQMREQAAEVSRLLGAEIEHTSRSYAEHARAQMEESAGELAARNTERIQQAADTRLAAFTDEVQRAARTTLGEFTGAAGQAAQRLARETAEAVEQLLTRRVEEQMTAARESLNALFAGILAGWQQQRDARAAEWQQTLARLAGESVENYQKRLENTSNAWIVAAATTFNQQGQLLLEAFTRTAEDRLRQACAGVFAGLGPMVSERLKALSAELTAQPPQPETK